MSLGRAVQATKKRGRHRATEIDAVKLLADIAEGVIATKRISPLVGFTGKHTASFDVVGAHVRAERFYETGKKS